MTQPRPSGPSLCASLRGQDVLLGDYEACVKAGVDAVRADGELMKCSPITMGPPNHYFVYLAHNVSTCV
jgi:hypothetical protein